MKRTITVETLKNLTTKIMETLPKAPNYEALVVDYWTSEKIRNEVQEAKAHPFLPYHVLGFEIFVLPELAKSEQALFFGDKHAAWRFVRGVELTRETNPELAQDLVDKALENAKEKK